MRADNRLILRDAVPSLTTPLLTPCISSGWASLSAVIAAFRLPEAMAASTFFSEARMTLLRLRFTSVRVVVCRMRFSADLWLAMSHSLLKLWSVTYPVTGFQTLVRFYGIVKRYSYKKSIF